VIALAPGGRVYLACGVTDMRKGMVGLAMLVQQGLDAEKPSVINTDKGPTYAAALAELKTAYATIKGFEVMRALRKGQASAFNVTRDIRGKARIVERAFGLGASALAEAAQFLNERLQIEAA
jgi:hypothetical protein